jgi:glycosyltransferase involved in cell wall biosynthesis
MSWLVRALHIKHLGIFLKLNDTPVIHNQSKIMVVQVQGQDKDVLDTFHIQSILNTAGIHCEVFELNGVSAPVLANRPESTPPKKVDISVIIPVYNEETNLKELHRRLSLTFKDLKDEYEIIFIDDGSKDGSASLLEEIYQNDSDHVRLVCLSRNFGHQQAISAGLTYSSGKAMIVMDADLQDPPEVLPRFIEKWKEGYQVVYAIREKRKEGVAKRLAYHTFYRILKFISRINIPLDTGDFGLMDRKVVDIICSLPERNRFVRGLRSWTGFRQTGLAYERDVRFSGETKYSFRNLFRLALDGMISFSYLPLRLATLLGFVISTFSILFGAYYFFRAITVGIGTPGFATSTILMSLLGGRLWVTNLSRRIIFIVFEYLRCPSITRIFTILQTKSF